jgi:PIN domain nuclease of toxin-antitoxin system
MRLLLDTHSFLWFINGRSELSISAKRHIVDLNNQVFVSVVSLWEIAIKVSIGKLILSRPFTELIPEQLEITEIEQLPVKVEHLSLLTTLPFHHRDPFDRLIIAQSLVEKLSIVSRDPVFHRYNADLLW